MNESLAKYYLQSNCTNVSLVYIQGWSLFECTSPLSFQIMLVFLFWILVYLFGYGLLIAYSYHLHFYTYASHNQGYPRYAVLP